MGMSDELAQLGRLVAGQRWAALATVDSNGQPAASMVGYAAEAEFRGVLIHVSRLASHTRNLLERPVASLVISEPDTGGGDPQQLARVALHGGVTVIRRDDAGYGAARDTYLARLPDAARLFDFPDFVLFRLTPEAARYVGGFGRAFTLDPADLARAAGLIAGDSYPSAGR